MRFPWTEHNPTSTIHLAVEVVGLRQLDALERRLHRVALTTERAAQASERLADALERIAAVRQGIEPQPEGAADDLSRYTYTYPPRDDEQKGYP